MLERGPDRIPPAQDTIDIQEDPMLGRRVHSWVLVRPNKRDVTEPLFVGTSHGVSLDCWSSNSNHAEPAMGTVLPVTDPNFLGIESIWNANNYWINVQEMPLHVSVALSLRRFLLSHSPTANLLRSV
jgi:hypothetical protein